MQKINIIVFSKDRAAQLDLLLRSFSKYVDGAKDFFIIVIYKASDKNFDAGYQKIYNARYSPFIHLIEEETDFKIHVVHAIDKYNPHTVFFVDDDVFVRPFKFNYGLSIPIECNNKYLCESLRLSPHLDYCYPTDKKMIKPEFDIEFDPVLQELGLHNFKWIGASQDFGYPMSLDGHIFRTSDILPLIKKLKYDTPNILEGELARNLIHSRPLMICHEKSIIINNPVNKVQTINNNRHGNISIHELNNEFLNGKIIDLDLFDDYDNFACHEIMPINFVYARNSD